MEELDIGEVAKVSGLTPATLRYYESINLIRSIGRKGLRRQYSKNVIEKLTLIALGQSGGLSLTEIASMFGAKGELNIDRPSLIEKADSLDIEIERLTLVRDSLRHVADCPHKNHLECASFQKLLKTMRLLANKK
ncbi:helix-turn-helix domain-containing protein [Vibrio sonorensis]|uniref:helix-turn-helix domain-containing protein n=1 Tax=Vibrio sonorensis TaxID=1004316 RepID=UPI0008DAF99C|nr:helix-turn-helix domain-containing protein [Vibrio sonorensis]